MTAKRKIVHVVGNLETGGMQMLLVELLKRLDPQEFEPVVIHFSPQNHFKELFADRGWRCLHAPVTRSYRTCELRRLRDVLANEAPDIIHSHADHANFGARLGGLWARAPRLVAHYHNTYDHRMTAPFHRMEALLTPHTDALVACSHGVSDFLKANFDLAGRPVHALVNGIDLSKFQFTPGQRREARAANGVPPEAFHVIHTARLEPHKRPHLVLEAVARCARGDNDDLGEWRLTFVGGGSLQHSLEARTSEIDAELAAAGKPGFASRVVFAGWSNDVPRWIASADAFALASDNEGFGLAIVEAMAAGVPVIAPDIVGPREVVRHGYDGILLSGDLGREIATALGRIRHDAGFREGLSRNGAESARRYSIEKYAESMSAMYRDLCSRPGHAGSHPISAIEFHALHWRFRRLANQDRVIRKRRRHGAANAPAVQVLAH